VGLLADITPLRTRDFRRLWLAGVVTVIGGNLTIFAVPVQVYALTRNSAYVGLSGLFALVPLVVFGLWGGAWADAMDRRILLIIASCGLAVASLLLWAQAALAANNVWVVLCLLSVQQAFFAINSPTRSSAIPRMLPSDQLPAANSLKTLIAIKEKGVAFTSHFVNLHKFEQHEPRFVKINPNGQVPALVHDGKVVTESTVINEYLDDVFEGPPLRPADFFWRARMRSCGKDCALR